MSVSPYRIARVNSALTRPAGEYVLYWMVAARRLRYNFALQRAVELCRELDRPLLILEALRCDYPWASDRLHAFVLAGMRDNALAAKGRVAYYPYVEGSPGEGRGLLSALAERAAAVVTDDFPCFFLPRMVEAAGARLPVAMEKVDGNGLYPMRATDRLFTTAASFRRHLQKHLLESLFDAPEEDPLRVLSSGAASVPDEARRRWPAFEPNSEVAGVLARLPIDHAVSVVAGQGGSEAGACLLGGFLDERLEHYAELRNQPEVEAQSYLSPYLHFGHISSHEILLSLLEREDWSPAKLADRAHGSRTGFWGVSANAEAFLDQLVTWRELGFNRCALQPNYDAFDALPSWALETLAAHAADPRPHLYSLEELELARTHDELWNAAQRQLVREGTIHNYLRMLWGKKILEWARSPRDALAFMVELNNKYALDGRNPNSYSGIFWVLGRFDRAWGPERNIFGKVRYMSSENTARKIRVREYLRRYAA